VPSHLCRGRERLTTLVPQASSAARTNHSSITSAEKTWLLRRLRAKSALRSPSTPEVTPPPCLSSGVISFGSLNNFVKVNETVRALWAELLANVPDARLVLHIKETRARQTLLDLFAERGVASNRLSLIGYQAEADYLATYSQIDIALDTTPFAGGTTSFDALWMGVPLVTLAGERSSSRGGASILTSLGRSEWIARSPEQYIAIAQSLASDPQQLAAIRRGLRTELQASPLMDGAGFTRELEDAYHQAWEQHRASLKDNTVHRAAN
jgi:protein O-GlcNAc transferase